MKHNIYFLYNYPHFLPSITKLSLICLQNKSGLNKLDLMIYVTIFFFKLLSCVRLFVTPWTVAHQAPPSMGFSRQEHWSGVPLPSPGDLPDPRIEPRSPTFQADALTSEPPYVTIVYHIVFFCFDGTFIKSLTLKF